MPNSVENHDFSVAVRPTVYDDIYEFERTEGDTLSFVLTRKINALSTTTTGKIQVNGKLLSGKSIDAADKNVIRELSTNTETDVYQCELVEGSYNNI